jgi:hypothetical protein
MRDFRKIEREAMSLGIIEKDYTADRLFGKYLLDFDESNNTTAVNKGAFSESFIEKMISDAEEMGSYMELLRVYISRGIIQEEDGNALKKTLFSQYLLSELERDGHKFTKTENKLFKNKD